MEGRTGLFVPLLAVCFGCASGGDSSKSEPLENNLNPAQVLAYNMGRGVNIGNTMDCIMDGPEAASETSWGNPRITRDFIAALKGYGYKTVRLPVTWAEHMETVPDYIIDEDWMARVEEVVGWILGEGMYCIVNLHHDGGEAQDSWIRNAKDDPDGTITRFTAVWKQIAARFVNADERLIFEAMNEVGFDESWNTPMEGGYDRLNRLNQAFVDTVRAAGGGNAARFLVAAGYNTDIERTCDDRFKIPADTQENHLLLSLHYYTPSIFTIAEEPDNSWGYRREWGTAEDRKQLADLIDTLKPRFLSRGIPVIMGEYGVTQKNKDEKSRVEWMAAVTQVCLDNGICPVLWDTGGEISRRPPYSMGGSLKAAYASVKKE